MEERVKNYNNYQTLPLLENGNVYNSDVKVFNAWLSGRPVNRDIIREYFENMKNIGRKPATISRHRAAIKKAIEGMRGKSITDGERAELGAFFSTIKPGKCFIGRNYDDILTKDELIKMVDLSGNKTKLLIKSLYQTACRVSELINIRIDHCAQIKNDIKICIVNGKGGKERYVFMRKETFDDILKAWNGKTYLFEYKGKQIGRVSVYKMIRAAGKKIMKPVSPVIIRHSWASNKNKNKMAISEISQYLGHKDIGTTAKYYLHGSYKMEDILIDSI